VPRIAKSKNSLVVHLDKLAPSKKSKRKIDEAIKDNEQPDRTRLMVRKTANYDINVLMWKWFQEVRKRNIPLSEF